MSLRRRLAAILVASVTTVILAACGDPSPSDGLADPTDGPAAPNVQCLGVVASKCAEFLEDAQSSGGPVAVTAIRIVCTAPPCTVQQGQVTVDVLYANGQRTSMGTGWATVGGPQVLPPGPIPTAAPAVSAAPSR